MPVAPSAWHCKSVHERLMFQLWHTKWGHNIMVSLGAVWTTGASWIRVTPWPVEFLANLAFHSRLENELDRLERNRQPWGSQWRELQASERTLLYAPKLTLWPRRCDEIGSGSSTGSIKLIYISEFYKTPHKFGSHCQSTKPVPDLQCPIVRDNQNPWRCTNTCWK